MMYRIVALSLCLASVASAQPPNRERDPDPEPKQHWYSGELGRKRILHLSIATGAGLLVLANGTVLKKPFAPSECRWCDPPEFDRAARDAVVWDNTHRADVLSSIDAYVVAPIVGLSLLYISDHDAGWTRFLDDAIPVVETVAITQLAVQLIKLSVGRERPFVRYGSDVATTPDQNLSFPSGHAALGFAITASAGMIAHWRHYKTEPYVWATGIALSLSTEYLRMAADKHYLTDVVIGGGIGLAGGLLIPRMMRAKVPIVPVKDGVAVVGSF